MTTSEYPLVRNLQKIKNAKNLDFNTELSEIKSILLDEINHRGKNDKSFMEARFDVAKTIYGSRKSKIAVALSRFELKIQLENILNTHQEFDPEFKMSVTTHLLLAYLYNHKYYLGNEFFEVLCDVFGEKSDYVIDAMYNQLQKQMAGLMGRYYPNLTTAQGNKESFAQHFQEKYKDTYFEIMVIQFTNDFVKNGKCIPA